MRSIPGRRSSPHSDAAWLAARCRGECADGSVFLHATAVAFQAPDDFVKAVQDTQKKTQDAYEAGLVGVISLSSSSTEAQTTPMRESPMP